MEKLGKYELAGHLTNQNAGYSLWGFAKFNGRDYFVKQFLSPKYPADAALFTPELYKKKQTDCTQFEQNKIAVYTALNQNSDGNAVRVEEFFRIGPKYYMSMEKVDALSWEISDVAALPESEKRRLCSIIAHGIAGLHNGGLIHADLKHDNILFTKTSSGSLTAKIIDFDGSFLETAPPAEIIGDLVYFSPEACLSIQGIPQAITCKADVFALGILFHLYFSGQLPYFDPEKYNYPGEAVAAGGELTVCPDLPEEIAQLLGSMLSPDPEQRPAAAEVANTLLPKPIAPPESVEPHKPDEPSKPVASAAPSDSNPWRRAGDL